LEEMREMRKRYALLSLAAAMLIVMVGFLAVGSDPAQSLACFACGSGGVVDKAQSEAFTVKITFKNTGKIEGTWFVNIAFEGEKWTWTGTAQTLTLKPYKTKTLTWNGTVPSDAPTDSVARLIVYYDNSFVPLDWWIHVIPGAELAIASSSVE
jgi:cytochrome c oxidase assembly protein Cox11